MIAERVRTRLEVPIPCDLTLFSLNQAVTQLMDRDGAQYLSGLIVHPFAKHQALHIVYETGWHVPVEIDASLAEDEWILRGAVGEVHSAGG